MSDQALITAEISAYGWTLPKILIPYLIAYWTLATALAWIGHKITTIGISAQDEPLIILGLVFYLAVPLAGIGYPIRTAYLIGTTQSRKSAPCYR